VRPVPRGQRPPLTLQDKVAVVTGSASGIGEATVRMMAGRGAAVVVADIDDGGAQRVAGEIVQGGGSASAVAVDVSKPAQVQAMIDAALSTFGRVDILHNNAVGGSPLDTDVVNMDLDAWDSAMAVNLRGYLLGCRAVLPHMIERGSGVIINTSSNSALAGDLTRTAYGVSKAGINALTMYVATQYGRFGVRCNAISPGLVMTPRMESEEALPAGIRDIYQVSHLNPRFAYPDDIAGYAVFLASDAAEMINGQILCIDGGMLAHTPSYAHFLAASGRAGG
jgi:NAD(P)-dependent dehydrogenase (short-subunit alcohol dehydrogenase family)